VDPKVVRADEQLELLGQRHVLPDGDLGSTDCEVPDLAMDHRLGPADDLGLLANAQAPGTPQIGPANEGGSRSDHDHLETKRKG
jgi:hypothetical protein